MARHHVWFGTRDYMTWVPAPAAESSAYSKQSWRTSGQFLNGGAFTQQSVVGATEISLTWNPMSRNDVDLLRAFFEGVYGPGPFYYADPFGAENVLPLWLSVPGLNSRGAPGFRRPGNSYANTSEESGSPGTQGYPLTSTRYYVEHSLNPNLTFEFPIPPGHFFTAGVRGDSGVQLNDETITPLSVNDGLRYSLSTGVAGSGGSWASLSLSQNDPVNLQGLMARYRQPGDIVETYGRFIPGRGFGGLRLAEDPQISRYSSALDREAISATFIEVAPWEL